MVYAHRCQATCCCLILLVLQKCRLPLTCCLWILRLILLLKIRVQRNNTMSLFAWAKSSLFPCGEVFNKVNNSADGWLPVIALFRGLNMLDSRVIFLRGFYEAWEWAEI